MFKFLCFAAAFVLFTPLALATLNTAAQMIVA